MDNICGTGFQAASGIQKVNQTLHLSDRYELHNQIRPYTVRITLDDGEDKNS